MIPILYPAAATVFGTNTGLGFLSDAADCTVDEVLNGSFELQLSYPINGILFSSLADRSIIYAKPSPSRDPEPFRVYKSSKKMKGVITFYARHLSYDLQGIPINPFAADSAAVAMQAMKSGAVIAQPFSFSTNVTTAGSMEVKVPTSCRALLGGREGTLLGTFGGQLKYTGYTVQLLQSRGADRGLTLRYGINLVDVNQERNIADMYTGVLPFYYKEQDETLVELSPPIISLGTFDFQKILPLDLSSQFSAAPTAAELQEMATKFIEANGYGTPAVSIKVSQPDFSAFDGGSPAVIELGDVVRVYYERMAITAQANVVKTSYDVLANRYKSMEVGQVASTIVRTIAKLQVQVIENTTIINSGGGGGGGGGSAVAVFG